jgi:hypothetical protein
MDPSTAPQNLLHTFERLLAALDRVLELTQRAGDDELLLEWSGLAGLDATDLGDQLGMLFDVDAERRRQVIRAAIERLDQPPL